MVLGAGLEDTALGSRCQHKVTCPGFGWAQHKNIAHGHTELGGGRALT